VVSMLEYSSTRVLECWSTDRTISIMEYSISLQLFNYTIDIDIVTLAIIVAMSCIYKFIDNKVDDNEY
jgi:hypothetical protein